MFVVSFSRREPHTPSWTKAVSLAAWQLPLPEQISPVEKRNRVRIRPPPKLVKLVPVDLTSWQSRVQRARHDQRRRRARRRGFEATRPRRATRPRSTLLWSRAPTTIFPCAPSTVYELGLLPHKLLQTVLRLGSQPSGLQPRGLESAWHTATQAELLKATTNSIASFSNCTVNASNSESRTEAASTSSTRPRTRHHNRSDAVAGASEVCQAQCVPTRTYNSPTVAGNL